MHDPIKRAQDDLERIDAQMRKLQIERDQIAAFIAMYRRYAESGTTTASALPARPLYKKEIISNASETFLKEKGKPRPVGEIFNHLMSLNIKVSGKKPRLTLSGILNRDSRFHYIHGAGWSLTRPHGENGVKHEGPDISASSPSLQ